MILIEKILFLKRISIFKSLNSQELRVIGEVVSEEEFASGEILFSQGQQGDCMYFIVEGKVEIYTGTPPTIKILAVFEAGDFFGEMGLYDDKPRAASAMALNPSRVLVLRKGDFLELISDYPEVALGIMKELNQRIRDTNVKLTSFEGRIIDKSSKLYTRDYFLECMANEFLKAKKDQTPLSFVTLKVISIENSSANQPLEGIADQLVADLGRILNIHQRPTDLTARISDKKLIIMLSEANREGASAFQRRIQKDIQKLLANYREVHETHAEIENKIFSFPEDTRERETMVGLIDRD